LKLLLIGFLLACALSTCVQAENVDFEIAYDSSGLTVINLSGNQLEYIYHTIRQGLMAIHANMESFDEHISRITLTNEELERLQGWAEEAITTKITEGQKESRKSYSTTLVVRMDGNQYYPNLETVEAFQKIMKTIVYDRIHQHFSPEVQTEAR
jgi:hypothetical protein